MSNMPKARKPVGDDEFGPPEGDNPVEVGPDAVIQRLHQNYLTQIGELHNTRAIAEAHFQQAIARIKELESIVEAQQSVIEELGR